MMGSTAPPPIAPYDAAAQLTYLLPAVEDYFASHQATVPTLTSHSARVLSMGDKVMNADINELVLLVRSDAASAAEILRLANSTFFRRGQPVEGIDEAIIRLGRREVYNLLAELTTRSLFEPKVRQLYDLLPQHWYRLQHHAVTSAFGSGWLSTYLKAGAYEPAFIGGMFHDIGKLGALFSLGNLVLSNALPFTPSFTATAHMMETTHTSIGCRMLTQWQIAGSPQDICAYQHQPVPPQHPAFKQVHLVRIISSLDTLRDNAFVPAELDAELRQSLAALAVDDKQLAAIATKLQSITDHVTLLLGPKPVASAGDQGEASGEPLGRDLKPG
jgi:HD-like signal output (HDOD) protein